MDEHHWKSAWSIRSESSQPGRFLVEEIAHQKAAQFTPPDILVTQAVGKCGSTLDFERNILSAEAYGLGLRRGVDLQDSIQGAGCEPPASVHNAQHGRDRDFHSRSDLESLRGVELGTTGRKRRPDTGVAIGVP